MLSSLEAVKPSEEEGGQGRLSQLRATAEVWMTCICGARMACLSNHPSSQPPHTTCDDVREAEPDDAAAPDQAAELESRQRLGAVPPLQGGGVQRLRALSSSCSSVNPTQSLEEIGFWGGGKGQGARGYASLEQAEEHSGTCKSVPQTQLFAPKDSIYLVQVEGGRQGCQGLGYGSDS